MLPVRPGFPVIGKGRSSDILRLTIASPPSVLDGCRDGGSESVAIHGPGRSPQTEDEARGQTPRDQAVTAETQRADRDPLHTIQRLERGEIGNPPIRYLVNLAEVLECRLVDVCEDEWIKWTVLDASAPGPPPKGHWLPERE
jgi:hypothetical protein